MQHVLTDERTYHGINRTWATYCKNCRGWINDYCPTNADCPGPAEPAQVEQLAGRIMADTLDRAVAREFGTEPDPDEVRRALDKGIWATREEEEAIAAAAREWLRICEQHHPTIAQVVEACGDFDEMHLIRPWCGPDMGKWIARIEDVNHALLQEPSVADTPEAALQKLYADAVSKLRTQVQDGTAKLERLGAKV